MIDPITAATRRGPGARTMGIEFHDVGNDHARARAEEADDRKRRDRVDTQRVKAQTARFEQALRSPAALPPPPGREPPPADAKKQPAASQDPPPGSAGPQQPPAKDAATTPTKGNTPLDERLARLVQAQAKRADQLVTLQPAPPKAVVMGDPADPQAAAAMKKPLMPDELHELPVVKERAQAGRDSQRQQDEAGNTGSPPASAGAAPLPPRADASAATPPPRGVVPEGLLKQMVEYAAVHQRSDGVFEFRLGLSQGVLGGTRMRMQAHGNRRVSIQMVSGGEGGVTPEELAALVDALKNKGVEVVEAVVR